MEFYLISATAQQAEVSANTVRYYCRLGLLTPIRDSSGRRLFTKRDIQRIREIYAANMARRHRSRLSPVEPNNHR